LKAEHSIETLCTVMEVSTSGYYEWCRRQSHPGARQQQDQRLKEQISQIHLQSRKTYGAPRIQAELRAAGQRHGRNRIGRLMREQNLYGRQRRRFRVVTTDSKHDQPVAPNRLQKTSAPTGPNQIWVTDITYVAAAGRWLYLAAVLDLYSRRVVGWALSERIDTALVLAAWNMAQLHRQPTHGLLVHSDRGVQYASDPFRRALHSAQAVASMSRKANCYDNATMEAFWSTLKLELVYREPGGSFQSLEEARAALFEFIEVFYNRQRRHSALNYQTPAGFEDSNN
jgi:transposase InsO family protein